MMICVRMSVICLPWLQLICLLIKDRAPCLCMAVLFGIHQPFAGSQSFSLWSGRAHDWSGRQIKASIHYRTQSFHQLLWQRTNQIAYRIWHPAYTVPSRTTESDSGSGPSDSQITLSERPLVLLPRRNCQYGHVRQTARSRRQNERQPDSPNHTDMLDR